MENTNEEWADVPHTSGRYQVSNLGNVLGPRGIKPHKHANGRLCIRINLDCGTKKTLMVHRLVAEAFIGPIGDKCVLHRDGDCLNNTVTNLYLGTRADNAQDSIRHGTFRFNTKLSPFDIHLIKLLKKAGYNCQKLATMFDVGIATIWRYS